MVADFGPRVNGLDMTVAPRSPAAGRAGRRKAEGGGPAGVPAGPYVVLAPLPGATTTVAIRGYPDKNTGLRHSRDPGPPAAVFLRRTIVAAHRACACG